MPKIDLQSIHYRIKLYGEGETPGHIIGAGQGVSIPGAVYLAGLKFRPFQRNPYLRDYEMDGGGKAVVTIQAGDTRTIVIDENGQLVVGQPGSSGVGSAAPGVAFNAPQQIFQGQYIQGIIPTIEVPGYGVSPYVYLLEDGTSELLLEDLSSGYALEEALMPIGNASAPVPIVISLKTINSVAANAIASVYNPIMDAGRNITINLDTGNIWAAATASVGAGTSVSKADNVTTINLSHPNYIVPNATATSGAGIGIIDVEIGPVIASATATITVTQFIQTNPSPPAASATATFGVSPYSDVELAPPLASATADIPNTSGGPVGKEDATGRITLEDGTGVVLTEGGTKVVIT